MADPSFEQLVCRLYAEPPATADASAFAAKVSRRLERGWALRRVLIGAAGVVGGLIAAAQVVGANVVQRVSAASETADNRAHDVADIILARSHLLFGGHLPIGGEALWMVGGLAAVGVALAAARVMETF
jgi:hypothetical protein